MLEGWLPKSCAREQLKKSEAEMKKNQESNAKRKTKLGA